MDERAALIEPLIPGLRRYARGWLRDAALADDIVQDCLERAVSSWRQRRGDAVRPWLYAILHNLLVDHGRRTPRRATLVPIDTADEVALAVRAEQTDAIERDDLLPGSAERLQLRGGVGRRRVGIGWRRRGSRG